MNECGWAQESKPVNTTRGLHQGGTHYSGLDGVHHQAGAQTGHFSDQASFDLSVSTGTG